MKVALIGGGNMARSLAGGLLRAQVAPGDVVAADPSAEARAAMEALGVRVEVDNAKAAAAAGTVVLAVKPQSVEGVSREIRDVVCDSGALVISIAAGIGCAALSRWLGTSVLVRAMPNTPALVGASMTVLFPAEGAGPEQRRQAETILRAVGEVEWVKDESLLDAVTAVSGSGPAYFFLVMEALEQAAAAAGLDGMLARRLVRQTALGAALMAQSDDPALLRERVTSRGGTTEQGIAVLEEAGTRRAFSAAVAAACRRSRELSELLR
ncbi:MAG: pyrroline-5-carboxylate reductase [Acidiferrobacteraceae bacterium]